MRPQRQQTTRRVRGLRTVPVRALMLVIDLYRNMVSPLRLPSCRFMPTCSQYAVDALGEYGLIRGSWLAGIRLAKCGPWHRGGWDPIPERPGCCSTGSGDAVGRGLEATQRESESVV